MITINIFSKHKKYYQKMLLFFDDINKNNNNYITKKSEIFLIRKYKPIYKFFKFRFKNKQIRKFIKLYSSLEPYIQTHNSIYFKNQLNEYDNLLNNVDGKSLDMQQKMAVLSDENNNLVIAGAGSGKTLTISGKVKYLIESGKAKSDEILLISFTDKAVKEMTERLHRIDIDVKAKTFHKLGLDIITNFQQTRPSIATGEFLDNIISNYFKKEILNFPEQIKNILEFMTAYLYIPEDISNFENLGDYIDNFRNIDYETIESKYLSTKNDNFSPQNVHRLDDLIISNFLFLNSVKYKYQYLYPFEAENSFKRKVHMNFYLPENDLYLEHFLIDEKGHSKFLSKYEEQKYLAEINLKRSLHAIHNTKLIETYSYYNKNQSLIPKLSDLLLQNNVVFKDANLKDIFSKIYIENQDKEFEEFVKLITTFLGLFKSSNFQMYDIDRILKENEKIENNFLKNRNRIFMEIFKSFYDFYESSLASSGKIDFNDMINKSTEIVKLGFIPENYKYIIIDEYQDISVSRFKLIKALQNQTNAKVICVGDDWQSIYRFSGSDIDLFSNFEKYFGPSKLLKIEKTYRNSQELIDIASNFVTQNPSQLTKDLKSDKHIQNPLKMMTYSQDITQAVENSIKDILTEFGEEKDILLLGRTKYDIFKILGNNNFKASDDCSTIIYTPIPNLKISFLTVHKSKGLEADNVILLNMENSLLGFPNRISSDPVLSLVLSNHEEYLYAEERRLFYVAITRTKNRTYLIAPEAHYSQFLDELLNCKAIEKNIENKLNIDNSPKCLKCQKGHLVIRKNNDNDTDFLGCSNYPHCDFTINDMNVLQKQVICNKCGGYIVEKSTSKGSFYACSNYPFCKNVMK